MNTWSISNSNKHVVRLLNGGIPLLPICEINYVNMQHKYYYMRLIYVNMQDNYVDMEHNISRMFTRSSQVRSYNKKKIPLQRDNCSFTKWHNISSRFYILSHTCGVNCSCDKHTGNALSITTDRNYFWYNFSRRLQMTLFSGSINKFAFVNNKINSWQNNEMSRKSRWKIIALRN